MYCQSEPQFDVALLVQASSDQSNGAEESSEVCQAVVTLSANSGNCDIFFPMNLATCSVS